MEFFKRKAKKSNNTKTPNQNIFTESQMRRATTLVGLANGIAISSYVPLLDKYPDLEVIAKGGQMKKWDFLITVAGVGIAFTRLANSVKEDEVKGYSFAIKQALENWDRNGYTALVDFSKYFFTLMNQNTITDSEKFKGAVGAWVIFKIEEDPHSNNMIKKLIYRQDLFPVIGNEPYLAFGNFWNEIEKA